MENELKDLKSVLRSIVVSSPAQMDVRSLQRDYKNMMGAPIPLAKYGYRDVLVFLKERCSDCFLFHGLPSNPVLTLIVPDTLKHIDIFVKKQRPSAVTKMKGKRRSVHETCTPSPEKQNLVSRTFNRKQILTQHLDDNQPEVKPPDIKNTQLNTSHNNTNDINHNGTNELTDNIEPMSNLNLVCENVNSHINVEKNGCNGYFLNKRLPMYENTQYLDSVECSEADLASSKGDNDSGGQTSSSQSSTKRAQLEELKCEIHELIKEHEDGILCIDLVRLYRERYGRELDFNRFGHNNVGSLLYAMAERVAFYDAAGGLRVLDAARQPRPAAAAPPHPRPRPPRLPSLPSLRALPVDPDDALPGIDFDPDVFPADCMHFMESIPALNLRDVDAGAMLEVAVGEVYSPSHFWVQRLGPRHSLALDEVMDEMCAYYGGEGRARELARGAVRPGQYCSSVYERDWHRSLIVKVVDADTVKVRHVDYGTVETVRAAALKPLLRRWAALPAQAARARLAGLRPGAGGRRWPRAAAAHFLHLVRDKRFVANVVALHKEEDTIETFLIDTSGAEDVCVTTELIRAGYADARADSALGTGECYLYPRFEALESGDTPNYAEIHRYLADGISLEYVEAYRRHVPAALPAAPAPPAPPAPAAPAPLEPQWRDSPPPASPSTASPAPLSPRSLSPPSRDSTPPADDPVLMSPAAVPELPATVPPPPNSARHPSANALSPRPPGPSPPPAPPLLQWRVPAPPLRPCPRPLRPGEVWLSLQECDMYTLLSSLDPVAAQCYMLSALRRAASCAPRPLNPLAPEFRATAPPLYTWAPLAQDAPPPLYTWAPFAQDAPQFGSPPPYMRPPPPPPGF